MARTAPKPKTRSKSKPSIEWTGALLELQAHVQRPDGSSFAPEALLWFDEEGSPIGHEVGEPGTLVGKAAASFDATVTGVARHSGRAPNVVRVNSEALAAALREANPTLKVIHAPTPEAIRFLRALQGDVHPLPVTPTFLQPGVDAAAVASFFQATAALYRSTPWKKVPDAGAIIAVTIEPLSLTGAVLSIFGRNREPKALLWFKDVDDFDRYGDAARSLDGPGPVEAPPHCALTFEPPDLPHPALIAEIREHGWELADVDAYPSIIVVEEGLEPRAHTPTHLAIGEAIARALPQFLEHEDVLVQAWDDGPPVTKTYVVSTLLGEVEITLAVPYDPYAGMYRPPFDVMAALAKLGEDVEDGIDPEKLWPLDDELVRRFSESPEASPDMDFAACKYLLDFAGDYFHATVATLQPMDLHTCVFETIPHSYAVPAAKAPELIRTFRAFFAYLLREFDHGPAEQHLITLGGDAVERLTVALADRKKYGTGKAIVMAGMEAGHDMQTREGIEAWMRQVSSKPLPDSFFPRAPTRNPKLAEKQKAAMKAKKDAQKAARKARKKNR